MRNKMMRGFVLAILLLANFAFASKKYDLLKQAQTSADQGRLEDAARLFCQASNEDTRDASSKQNCFIYSQQLAGENARNEERFTDGVRFFNDGRFDDAEQKFKNIRTGPHLQDAQQYLANKIPAARAKAAVTGQEDAMSAKFDEAVQAFNNNALDSARTQFSQVTGSHQTAAQDYLRKIQSYQQAMQNGDIQAENKNYKDALASYTQAKNIKGDGPGDPSGKISRMQDFISAANTPRVPPASIHPPPHPAISAITEPARPKFDIQKLLREADAAKAQGDYGAARGKYLAVLAEDPRNAQALAGKESLPVESGASNQQAGAEADIMLAKGIGEFYSGKYEDAEVHIKDYIEVNGAKSALAYFYRATSLLTRYYLAGERSDDKNLITEAQDDFRNAKKSLGFNPPEKLVSPKIMRIFKETS